MSCIRVGRLGEGAINRVLYFLRAEAIRERKPGLEHVEAIHRLRGLGPYAVAMPLKRPRYCRPGELRRAVLAALRDGPTTTAEIATGLATDRAVERVRECLVRMEKAGMVRREGRVWQNNTNL